MSAVCPPLSLTLAVRDPEATAAFYRELLDIPLEKLRPLPGSPASFLLRRGDAAILFRDLALQQALHPALFQALDRHPLGQGVSLELTVEDLGPLRARLERSGWPVVYELEDEEATREELWLHDPDGYLLVLSRERG